MSTWVSIQGKWVPANEVVALVNVTDKTFEYDGKKIEPGEPFIYRGPDRVSIKELDQAGVKFLGRDFKHDPEFRQAVRNQGFETVEQYFTHIGYDEKAELEKCKENTSKFKSHEIPKQVKEINEMMTGGRNTAGSGDSYRGGFGEANLRKA